MALFHTTVLDNQIKALPTSDTASGAIATFDTDLTENLVEVKCQIVAKQASGTPSPDNPLPITTYTEMNLTRCGANLLNPALRVNGYYISATGVITPEANSCYIYIKVNVGETYTFSGRAYGTGNKRVHAYDENKNWIEQLDFASMSGTGDYSVTVTIPSGCQYVGLSYAQADAYLMLVNGSSVLPYVAYNGTTSNIPFGQTVANGVLDITTGKLRVTWGILNLSDFTWILASSNDSCNRFSTAGVIPLASQNTHNNICSFDTGGWIQGNSITSSVTTVNALDIRTTSILVNLRKTIFDGTAEQFNTWIADKQICYELATPIEIQLDSITLQALLNENNIWCDTGDTEVKFLLSVGKAIS